MEWINPEHLATAPLNERFRAAMPFPHLELQNFLREEKARELEDALVKQDFERKESDLFCLYQTPDLLSVEDKTIGSFTDWIASARFRTWMEEITGIALSGTVDAMGALYTDTDYLLCHDDLLEGRKIAYILQLSEGFTEESGGALALLDADTEGRPGKIARRIVPKWNALCFFEVSERSHHMVEEVLEDIHRLTIGGWLHG